MSVKIIAAVDEEWGFGKGGSIPWFISEDFKHFKETTMNSICIMGRITYEEIRDKMFPNGKNPSNKHLLPNRQSIVLTTTPDMKPLGNVKFYSQGLPDLINLVTELQPNKDIFLIGGGQTFTEGLKLTDEAYISHIDGKFDCDVFFPHNEFNKRFKPVEISKKNDFTIIKYMKGIA